MKPARTSAQTQRDQALHALQLAIRDGATQDYERRVDAALAAGISADELDLAIHDALERLFFCAEQPVTSRALAQFPVRTLELQFV